MKGQSDRPSRLLIIRLSSLGDVILAALLVRSLKNRYPKSAIDFLTREPYRPLLKAFPNLKDTWVLERRCASRRQLVKELVHRQYDAVIDLQNNLRSRALTARLSPARVFRYHRPRLNRWLRINMPDSRPRLAVPPPVALGYLKAAGGLDVADDSAGLELQPPMDWVAAAAESIGDYKRAAGLPLDSPTLIATPGARHATKIWLPGRWSEMLTLAYNAGWQSQIIVGSPADAALGDEIQSQLNHPILNLTGKTNLEQLTGIIASAAVFVGSDSGPMHLAAGVGTPVVAIFGPTVPEFGFAPFRCRSVIVQIGGLNCRPCHPHGPKRCPLGHFRCMSDISVPQVLAALHQAAPLPSRKNAAVEVE